jgi:hypothetical protein
MPRNSSTLGFLFIALGLLCYITFIDKKIPGTEEREQAGNQLFQLNPDDVIGLEITNVHGVFIFQKVNHHWEIKKPVNTLADGPVIDGVINQIAFAAPQRLIEIDGSSDKDQANLKEWGLIPPTERVVIHTKDKQYELLIGRKMAISDAVYARASDKKNEPVKIIADTIKTEVDKDLSEFRSRSVFDFNVDNVTKLAMRVTNTATTPGLQYELDKKDSQWTLQMPLVARAAANDVQGLLGKVLAAHIDDFVTDDSTNLSPYGLISPTETITVTITSDKDASPEDIVLQLGGPVPGKPDDLYALRLKSNSVFTVQKAAIDDLLKTIANVRDRHILPFDPNKPTGVAYSIGTKKAQIHAEHTLWSTVGDAEGPADPGKAIDLVVRLSQLETTPVLKDSATDLKPFGLDKPQGKITIQSPEFKSEPLTLLIGKDENKLLYVRNSIEPFIYTVPDTAFDFLPANNLAFRDPRAINLKQDQVRSMDITVEGKPAIKLTRSPGGTWSATNMKDRMVDGTKADTQAALFCQLQAKTWLGPVLPAYGLSKPVLIISLTADQPTPTVLEVGAALPDGSHAAQIEGRPTAFSISDGDYGILNASSLQLIPAEVSGTNASASTPPTNAPSTNAAPATK